MNFKDFFKNNFLYNNSYKTHSEAVIIVCYFNPQENPYRLKAFNLFYESIKHLNHRIVECVIGDAKPQLEPNFNIIQVKSKTLLWHKESLLNEIIRTLPSQYKYVFWVDADVIFTNKNWLVDGVKKLQKANIIQPFEYCVHLEKDQLEPYFDITHEYEYASNPKAKHPMMWRSFSANHATEGGSISGDSNYDRHGHVGFAWGAKRSILDNVKLYDKALIGGADHIIAHAAVGQINHSCITKSFTDDIDNVNNWSKKFYLEVQGKIDYVKGDLYHIWHGDIKKRDYLNRIKEFTPTSKNITTKDKNGLYVADSESEKYVKKYFDKREVKSIIDHDQINLKREELRNTYPDRDDSFIESLLFGYLTNSTIEGTLLGNNPLGAMLGDMLNTDENKVEYGGGESGGAGSGGNWDNNETFS